MKDIEAGADDFPAKPINQAKLFARVRSLLRIKALQDEVRRQADELKEWNAGLEVRVAIAHDGTIDRFAGDGILIFFNDPFPVPEPGRRAASMALAMQAQFAPLRTRWQALGHDLDLGIGIALGFATLGAFGFEGRRDYTAIGSVVNLADRLCGEAQGGQILIDRRTRARLGEEVDVEPAGPFPLKGYAQPVPAFVLKGLRSAAN